MRYQTHLEGVWSSALAEPTTCPGCERATILRKDTGRCEVCTAKLPAQRAAWEKTRKRFYTQEAMRERRRQEPVCPLCSCELGGHDLDTHWAYHCADRKFSCRECGKRFYLSSERDRHLRVAHDFAT